VFTRSSLVAVLLVLCGCQTPAPGQCDPATEPCGSGGAGGGGSATPACEKCPGLDLCKPSSGACPQCFNGQGCSAPNAVCDEPTAGAGGNCVRCLRSIDCGSDLLCELSSKSCVVGIPDTCDRPRELVFDAAGKGSLRLDTRGATDDFTGSCQATPGPDVIVRFHLDAPRDVVLTTAAISADADPVLYVRSGSGGCAGGTELACDDGFGRPDRLELLNLPAGDHFVVVDSYGATGAGEVLLDATLSAATPAPGNDTCANAQALVFQGASATASGTTRAAGNDAAGPSCNTSAQQLGRDVVFKLTLSSAQDVLLEVEPAVDSELAPVLSLRPFAACASGAASAELGCKEGFFPKVRALNLQPGEYAVWVDSADGTDGPFSLKATLLAPTPPPANDTCATASVLSFVGGVATVSGSTAAARNDNVASDESPFCSWAARSAGGDVLYRFSLAQPQDVEVKVTPKAGSPLSPLPYLRSWAQCSSGAKNDELACQSASGNTVNTLSVPALPAGDYALWVDTASDEGGAFDLQVKLTAPTATAPGDTCLSPIPVTLSGSGTQSMLGSTRTAHDDYKNACELGSSGPDVVYQLTLPVAATLKAAVTPVQTTQQAPQVVLGRPWLSLRAQNQCASVTSTGSLGCVAAGAPGEPNRLTVFDLPAGTYDLIVDSAGPGTDFMLDLTTTPKTAAAPGNQTCATATPLTLSNGTGRIEGTTHNANSNTYNMACRTSDSQQGKDVVFKFTTPALAAGQTSLTARVTVQTQNADAFAPILNVRSNCAGVTATDQLLCEASSASPYLASGTVSSLSPSTTYFVWVDEAIPSLPGSAFTLSVDVAAGPAANETCSAPQVLPTNYAVPGSTLAASNQMDSLGTNTWYDGSGCNVGLPGPEVVYAWTAPASGQATARVAPQLGFDAALVLLSACAPSSCLQVMDQGDVSTGETIAFSAVAGKTYFFAVDSYTNSTTSRANRGAFLISVEQ
jgi:hypothetical protein